MGRGCTRYLYDCVCWAYIVLNADVKISSSSFLCPLYLPCYPPPTNPKRTFSPFLPFSFLLSLPPPSLCQALSDMFNDVIKQKGKFLIARTHPLERFQLKSLLRKESCVGSLGAGCEENASLGGKNNNMLGWQWWLQEVWRVGGVQKGTCLMRPLWRFTAVAAAEKRIRRKDVLPWLASQEVRQGLCSLAGRRESLLGPQHLGTFSLIVFKEPSSMHSWWLLYI